MSLFINTEPPRLHKQTWVEKHRFEILVLQGTLIILFLFILAFLVAEPTVTGVV